MKVRHCAWEKIFISFLIKFWYKKLFVSYVYTFWSLILWDNIIYSCMFISNCKNMQGIFPFICRLFNRTCVAECISAFQIKCTSVSRDESRIGDWFLPRLYSSMRFTEKQRCTTAFSSFFPFFSAWEYIYSASGVPEKHGCLRAWPSFCRSVWVPPSYLLSSSSFQPFLS